MKRFLIVTSVCLLLVACACSVSGNVTDELHIGVRLTTGEHSRDSSSQTTAITVDRDTIVCERTFTGRRRGTPPLRKEFKLSSADKLNLLTLIRSNKLLVTDSLELPRRSSNYRYFGISVELTLHAKEGCDQHQRDENCRRGQRGKALSKHDDPGQRALSNYEPSG